MDAQKNYYINVDTFKSILGGIIGFNNVVKKGDTDTTIGSIVCFGMERCASTTDAVKWGVRVKNEKNKKDVSKM